MRWDRTVKKTRKEGRCCWCNQLLKVGEPAVWSSGIGDDFWFGRFHPECREAESRWWQRPENRNGTWDCDDLFVRGSEFTMEQLQQMILE